MRCRCNVSANLFAGLTESVEIVGYDGKTRNASCSSHNVLPTVWNAGGEKSQELSLLNTYIGIQTREGEYDSSDVILRPN